MIVVVRSRPNLGLGKHMMAFISSLLIPICIGGSPIIALLYGGLKERED